MEKKRTPQGANNGKESTNPSHKTKHLTKPQKSLLIFFLGAEACCLMYFFFHSESMHVEIKVMMSITCLLRNVGLYHLYQLPHVVSKIEWNFTVIFLLLFISHFAFFHDWKYGFYICDSSCFVIIAEIIITFSYTRILCLVFNILASRNL